MYACILGVVRYTGTWRSRLFRHEQTSGRRECNILTKKYIWVYTCMCGEIDSGHFLLPARALIY